MSITCPKCGTVNRQGAKSCALCGVELESLSFEELFGPPTELKGRYAIQKTLRPGTVVSLYEAIDRKQANQPCLIQEMTPTLLDWQDRQDVEERFLMEAAAWQNLRHPNIARFIDAFAHSRRLYAVTEAPAGVSLQSVVKDRRQKPSEATLLHWARQLCDVLDYLHNQNPPLALGYLSPSAIRIDAAGDVKLVDFGLTRFLQQHSSRGVRGYEAPEQRQGEVTPLSDIYSLGIILYAVATHHDPTERPLPPLHKRAPHLSETTTKIITRAFMRKADKRFASAAAMRDALRAAGSPAALEIELPPFVLSEGQEASTLRDLVRLCATNWDDGLRALVNGRIADWLTLAAQSLRDAGQQTAAGEIEEAAYRTTQALEKMLREASRPGREEIAPHAAFASWLEEMGAAGVQPSLQVGPRGFDFEVIPASMKAIAEIQIRNKGQGYLTGHVESPLPWLTVPSPIFGCRAGETVKVKVVARGRRLPPGRTKSPQAILVSSNGGQTWLEARAESARPEIAVEPSMLDFGPITRSGAHMARLTISNRGGGLLSGRVVSKVPWLRVRHPAFRCPAGASARIAIELMGAKMPPEAAEANRLRQALLIDSDSGQVTVGIAWTWARPGLSLNVTALNFGPVEQGARLERILTLSNPGTADLVGQVSSEVDWLTVEPVEFRCPPGGEQIIMVRGRTARLPGGDTLISEAIRIKANAGQQSLSAAVEVLAAELLVEPMALELGTVRDGQDVEMTVMVSNPGSLPWEGEIFSNAPWLTVTQDRLLCEPGHSVPVIVVLNTAAFESGGEWSIKDALRIVGQGKERSIAAHVALERPQLLVERHSLDFGVIEKTEVVTLPLRIANAGTGELEWWIEWPKTGLEAWLEVEPTGGTCAAGEEAIVQVKAYALALTGEAGQAWLTVHSNAGRADLSASVTLSAPRLVVEPPRLNLGASENYAPLSQTMRVSNRGMGLLQGTVTARAPWLSCSPAKFECHTGASALIEVQAHPQDLRQGEHEAADALWIESNGGNEEVSAQLSVVLTPRLHLGGRSLSFSPSGPARQEIVMENQGYGALRLQTVPNADWIKVNRRDWTIKAGRKARLKVSVTLDDAPADKSGAVEIHTAGEIIKLSVQVER